MKTPATLLLPLLFLSLTSPGRAQEGGDGAKGKPKGGLSISGQLDTMRGGDGSGLGVHDVERHAKAYRESLERAEAQLREALREHSTRDLDREVEDFQKEAERFGEALDRAKDQLNEELVSSALSKLHERDYALAIPDIRAALSVSDDPRLRVGLAEAYLGEARRLDAAASATQDPARAKELRQKARDLRVSSGSHLRAAPDLVLERAAALEKEGQTRASMNLYRAALIASQGKNDPARAGLAEIYGKLSRSNTQRGRYRPQQREHLLQLTRSSDPKVAAKARQDLRAMAAEVPLQSQRRLGTALVNDPAVPAHQRAVDRGEGFCGIASFATIAEAEGVTPRWTNADTAKAAYGTSRTPGAYVIDANGDGHGIGKGRLATVATREFGLPAEALGNAKTKDIQAEINAGRPVMVGGERETMIPTARYEQGRWTPLNGRDATDQQISYSDHWFVVVGYKTPAEQTPRERMRSGGQTLWQVQDSMRVARLEVLDSDFQRYTQKDKWIVRFRPQAR